MGSNVYALTHGAQSIWCRFSSHPHSYSSLSLSHSQTQLYATSTAEIFFYFYPVVIPLLSSYNLLFLHFDFTRAIHTWNLNKKNFCMPPCPWDAAHQTCESKGWQCHRVWQNWILHPAASSLQKEGDLPLCSPQSLYRKSSNPFSNNK